MGFLDFLRGGSGSKKCAYCKRETENLPFTKTLDGKTRSFCSKECSRNYRIARKKQAKKSPTTGGSLPW